MKERRRIILLFIVLMITVWSASAQDSLRRKRVAVVLSGGGARGMAHIGVLKVIERAGIPIDIITGTSMGSIIGGLYAIDYDAHRLDSMVKMQDWGFLLSDKADVRNRSLDDRRKQNTYFLLRTFHWGNKKSAVESGGLITGKNLSALFDRLTVGYHDSIDFNRLPIPFACVATNIIDNTEYDFHSGVLAQAMRSSMAIPAVFSPVRKGNMVLVDGGLRNNYPADLAREMGADIIIGVTVQSLPKSSDDLKTSAGIVSQIIEVNCKNKYEENLAITDVAIRVNPQGYSAANFGSTAIDTLINRGEAEAMKHWDELMALKKIIGIGDDFTPARPVLHPKVLRKEEQTIDSRLVKTTENTQELGLGVRFDTEEMVALQINGAYRPRNSKMDFEATLRLGKRIMARIDGSFNPFGMNRTRLSYIYRHNDINQYNRGKREFNVAYNQHSLDFNALDFNVRNFNVAIGARWDFYDFREVLIGVHSNVGIDRLNNEHYFTYYADVNYNSENKWIFASRGAKFSAGFAYCSDKFTTYQNHSGFTMIKAMWRISLPLNSHLTFQPMAYGRLLFGSDIPYSQRNMIGGIWFNHYVDHQMPFVGTGQIERTDNMFIALQLQLQQRIMDNNYILLGAVGAQRADKIREILRHGPLTGAQISYFYNSIFGPLGASLGYSTTSHKPYFYINLGFEF